MATHFNDVPAWPEAKAKTKIVEVSTAPPPMGHNRPDPSVDVLAEFRDQLLQRKGDFDQRALDLAASADRAAIIDVDTYGKGGELKKQIAAMIKVVDDSHRDAKEPYLAATRAVDGARRDRKLPLETALALVQGKLDTFAREEQAKRDAEERRQREIERAEQQAQRDAEEAARAANLPPPEPAPTAAPRPAAPAPVQARGDYGALTSSTKVWKSEVADFEVAFIAGGLANNAKVREAISTAIAAMVRAGVHEIEGVRIWQDTVARVR